MYSYYPELRHREHRRRRYYDVYSDYHRQIDYYDKQIAILDSQISNVNQQIYNSGYMNNVYQQNYVNQIRYRR